MTVCLLLLFGAWTEGFEAQNYFPPDYWIVVNEDALDAVWYRDTTQGHGGTRCAVIDGDTSYAGLSFTNKDYLITSRVLPGGGDTLLSFWYRSSSSAGCSLDVLVSTSAIQVMPSFNLVQTFQVTEVSWTQRSVSLSGYSGTPVYIAFRIRRVPTGQRFYLDDITLPPMAGQSYICHGRLRTKGSPAQKYLQAWGSHYEMGYAHGFLLAEEVMAQFSRWLIGPTLLHMFSPYQWENQILSHWRVRFSVPAKYQEEAQGLYDGLVAKGVSLTHSGLGREITVEDILCYNAMADYVMFMCSSVSGWGQSTADDDTLQGGLVMCRDLDFYLGQYSSLTNTSAILAYASDNADEQNLAILSFAGVFSVPSGVNCQGLGLCLNVGSYPDTTYIPPNSLVPIMFSIRDALETTDPDNNGVDDIFDITYSIDHSTSLFTWDMHLYSPCDTSHPTPAGIYELNNIGDSLRVVADNIIAPQINSQYNLAVTNHHRVLYPPEYCWRYQRMADSLNADFHLTTQRAIAIENAVAAEYTPTYGHCTAHQMVFRSNAIVEHPEWTCIGIGYARRRVAAHHFPKLWYSWNELFDGAPGVEEKQASKSKVNQNAIGATIFSGTMHLPEGRQCRVFDITGRVVMPDKIKPGVYFIEVDGQITQKVIKVR